MATKKVTKKPVVKKAAASKSTTTVRTVSASSAVSRPTANRSTSAFSRLDSNVINIVLAELVGTFVLTTVVLMTASDVMPLFVGLTLAVLVMTIGAVSGSHVNPAVTFGLWASKKLKSILLPFYWAAQLLGAVAALVVTTMVSGTKLNIDFFGHFGQFSWTIFFIELIGTAVFLWGLTAALSRVDLSAGSKAFGVGLSLFVAILVSTSLYVPARNQAIANYQTEAAKSDKEMAIPHFLYVSGATLNPAVALATTEIPESQLRNNSTTEAKTESETRFSRISWEVIFGTLIGAAIGANLTRLLNYRFR
ncbi:aquaporin [Candidatus Saccharibacteria bacterium]|nr:aquaporin [Candidatus Saccharibacteria bacterium]